MGKKVRVLILVGSTNSARRPRNPWKYDERLEMIIRGLAPQFETGSFANTVGDLYVYLGRFQPFHNGHKHVIEAIAAHTGIQPVVAIESLEDMLYATESGWLTQVQNIVSQYETDNKKVVLVGHTKDSLTNEHLSLFPQWGFLNVPYYQNIDASVIRKTYFRDGYIYKNLVPPNVSQYLESYNTKYPEAYTYVKDYMEFAEKYRAENVDNRKYPPTFQTVDAVVVQSGHVLVVERLAHPGKGLWALPGGFFNANSDTSLEEAMLRELDEETSINLQKDTLKRCIIRAEPFDHMYRSELGRIITMAYLIHLKPGKLIKVKGGDDAKRADWMPLSEVRPEDFHDDHGHIIRRLTRDL